MGSIPIFPVFSQMRKNIHFIYNHSNNVYLNNSSYIEKNNYKLTYNIINNDIYNRYLKFIEVDNNQKSHSLDKYKKKFYKS